MCVKVAIQSSVEMKLSSSGSQPPCSALVMRSVTATLQHFSSLNVGPVRYDDNDAPWQGHDILSLSSYREPSLLRAINFCNLKMIRKQFENGNNTITLEEEYDTSFHKCSMIVKSFQSTLKYIYINVMHLSHDKHTHLLASAGPKPTFPILARWSKNVSSNAPSGI